MGRCMTSLFFAAFQGLLPCLKHQETLQFLSRQIPLSLMRTVPHPKDNAKWHDTQMNQYIFKSSRYPSTLIRVPGPVLVGLTLTRLCAGIITVPIKLEPTMNQVDS